MGGQKDHPTVAPWSPRSDSTRILNLPSVDDGQDAFVVVEREELAGGKGGKDTGSKSSSSKNRGKEPQVHGKPCGMPEAFQAIGADLAKRERTLSSAKKSFPTAKVAGDGARVLTTAPSTSTKGSSQATSPETHSQIIPCLRPTMMAASAYISASYDSTRELVLDYHKKAVDRLGDGRRSAQRMWRERAPLPPALGRVFKHRLFQIFCLTTLFLVVCMMPMLWVRPLQHGERKISSREWQAKYEELRREHDAKIEYARSAYDSLGAKHGALQAEHDALLNFLTIKEKRSCDKNSGGECKTGAVDDQKASSGSCAKDSTQGSVQSAKAALLAVERSTWGFFKQISDGMRRDFQEIVEAMPSHDWRAKETGVDLCKDCLTEVTEDEVERAELDGPWKDGVAESTCKAMCKTMPKQEMDHAGRAKRAMPESGICSGQTSSNGAQDVAPEVDVGGCIAPGCRSADAFMTEACWVPDPVECVEESKVNGVDMKVKENSEKNADEKVGGKNEEKGKKLAKAKKNKNRKAKDTKAKKGEKTKDMKRAKKGEKGDDTKRAKGMEKAMGMENVEKGEKAKKVKKVKGMEKAKKGEKAEDNKQAKEMKKAKKGKKAVNMIKAKDMEQAEVIING